MNWGRADRFFRLALFSIIGLAGCALMAKPRHAPVSEGEKAPVFHLPDQNGERVGLEGLLENGPVVLVFFRGHW